MKDYELKALRLFEIGIQYLDLTQKVALEISKSGNVWMFVQDGADFKNLDKEYEKATYWSDHNIAIPVLFNFYHGIELILKGLIQLSGEKPKGHKLKELFDKALNLYGSVEFLKVLKTYIYENDMPSLLKSFLNASKIDINEWYQAFKYPDSFNQNEYDHSPLKYQEEKGASFFNELNLNISSIRKSLVPFVRKNTQQ